MQALIIVAVLGFPVSLILAWIIDIRPDGLIFDLPLWVGNADQPREAKKTDLLYLVLPIVLLLGGAYSAVSLLRTNDLNHDAAPVIASTAPEFSIAVLAFENFSDDAQTDFFAEGLAEEILNLLNAVPELRVAARSSSFIFRKSEIDIREVAQRLAVRHVLEGSVRRSGDQIRVSARLVDGAEGYNQWNQVYDRRLNDVFTIQQSIAAAVVNELKLALSVDTAQQLASAPTQNIDAYMQFLQGRKILRSSLDADVVQRATQLFKAALELDPEFARAYAGICEAQLRLYEIGNNTAEFNAAENACERAAQLDPQLGVETRIALAKLYRSRGWQSRAVEVLEAVILDAPQSVAAFIELGKTRTAQGRPNDAQTALEQAIVLRGNDWRAHQALGRFYYRSERYAEAAAAFETVTQLAPDIASGFSGKGAAYWMMGDFQKAGLAYDRSLELKPSRQAYTNLGVHHYYAGRFELAAQMQRSALEYAPDDHRVWGRLAESLRYVEDSETERQQAYARAVELARTNLQVNPQDWATNGLLASYLARTGDVDQALERVSAAVVASKERPEALYYQALVTLQSGNIDGTFDALTLAVSKDDQYRRFVELDPDLRVLADDPRFKSLITD